MNLVIFLIIGGLAGWLAGQVRRGYGFGLVGNIILGVAGAFVGDFVFVNLLGVSTAGVLGTLFSATIGALLLVALVGAIRRG